MESSATSQRKGFGAPGRLRRRLAMAGERIVRATHMRRGRVVLFLLFAVACGLQAGVQGHGRDEPLVISSLVLIDSHDVDRHFVEETYRAELTHSGAPGSSDFAAVTAVLVGWLGLPHPPVVRVPDGRLEFGSVRAGATVESRDTITIRRLRYLPVKLRHLHWRISGRQDLVLPDAWAGTWRLTMTTRDATTNQIAAVDEITDSIGVAEAIGFSLMPSIVRCRWMGTELVLEADCHTRINRGACVLNAMAQFSAARDANALTGHGRWTLNAIGDCGPGDANGGALIEIGGVRVSADAETGQFSPGALTKLVTSPSLAALLAGQPGSEGQR